MNDNDVRSLKWVTGLIALVLLTLIIGGFIASHLHGQNSVPKIEGDTACVYVAKEKENASGKEWRCSKVN